MFGQPGLRDAGVGFTRRGDRPIASAVSPRDRSNPAPRLRAEAAFLAALVAGMWLGSAILGAARPEPARATAASITLDPAKALADAEAAQRARDLTGADRLYRIAWTDPRMRERAAAGLRSLERAGYPPPADEAAIAATIDLLGPGFERVDSAYFTLISDADRNAVRERLGILERTRDQFFRAMQRLGVSVIPPERRLIVVLFAEHSDYRAFAATHDRVEAEWVAGYYAGLSNRAVFFEDASGPAFVRATAELDAAAERVDQLRREASKSRRAKDVDRARALAEESDRAAATLNAERERLRALIAVTTTAKTVHEAVHLLAFNTGVQSRAVEQPFWLTEGLATSFETSAPHAAFGPDRAGEARSEELARAIEAGALVPLAELVSRADAPTASPSTTEAAYAQARSLFVYLHRTARQSLAACVDDLLNEPPGRMTNDRRRELFERRFGDIARVERRWLADTERTLGVVAGANEHR